MDHASPGNDWLHSLFKGLGKPPELIRLIQRQQQAQLRALTVP